MISYTRLLLTSLAATALLAIAVTSASARNLEISPNNWRVTWASLELNNTAGLGAVVRCRVTLEGSFHARTMPKVNRSLIGLITSAIVDGANCTGGSWTIKRETLPWHIQYGGFGGTLPRLSSITVLIVGMAAEIRNEAATCSFRTEALQPGGSIANVEFEGAITSLTLDRFRQITATGGLCPLARLFWEGTGTVTTQNSTTRIRVRLI